MAAEYPPISRIHVVGYSANDNDFPILNQILDPRVAGYRVPEDYSFCPDKRYPNHIFIGAQPISGDQRVRHVWEILPSPWVPFTRYDDDLGPIQGRRRSVKNEGQQASLTSSTKISYEGREGSAIVLTEIEETWSIKVDEDGNSLFPIKERDIYDNRLGAIKERRQLIVPTGEEKASLEYSEPTITQITYEPYNEYLSYKIITTYDLSGPIRREDIYDPIRGPVQRISEAIYDNGDLTGSLTENNGIVTQTIYQPINTLVVDRTIETYSVSGPQLIGQTTNNDGQLVTVTTQRKAAAGYVPPDPTATRSVEVSREDIASLVERITDAPFLFSAPLFRTEKEDVIPAKFRSQQIQQVTEQNVAGVAAVPSLGQDEISKTEQQINVNVKRVSLIKRTFTLPQEINEKILTASKQLADRKLTLSSTVPTITPSAKLISAEIENLGDGKYLKTQVSVDQIFDQKQISAQKPDVIPERFRANVPTKVESETVESEEVTEDLSLEQNELEKREERVSEFEIRKSTTKRDLDALALPTLYGQEYESTINIPIPFSEQIEASGTSLDSNATFIDPISEDYDLVKRIDLQKIQQSLDGVFLSFPTRATLSLPKVLKSVKITWDKSAEEGKFESEAEGDASGLSWSLSADEDADADSFIDINPSFEIDIEEIYANNIPTVSYFFFLPYPVTEAQILAKVGAQRWPTFKPKSHTISAIGVQAQVKSRAKGSASKSVSESTATTTRSTGQGTSTKITYRTTSATIPPCLHAEITVQSIADIKETVKSVAQVEWPGSNFPAVFVKVENEKTVEGSYTKKIAATNPTDVPRVGKYLIDSRVELYQYGYAKVYAEVVDATLFQA